MQVEGRSDFLQTESVRWVGPSKPVKTYHDEVDDDISNRKVGQTARMTGDGPSTNVDGSDKLSRDILRALVTAAATELGEDGIALVAERVECTDDVVVGPLRDNFGDGASEGHDTSGEDSEDSGETHGEEVCDEARRLEKATLAESDCVSMRNSTRAYSRFYRQSSRSCGPSRRDRKSVV